MNIPNKTFLVLMIGAASLAVFGPVASATTMQLKMNLGDRQSGDGGEFNVSSPDFVPATMGYAAQAIYTVPGNLTGFETFCVQTTQFFSPGSTYYYSISQEIINPGIGGNNPLRKGAAWLYLNFAKDTLANYNYTLSQGGNDSAAALQATLWWLEGDIPNAPNNVFTTAVEALPNYQDPNNGYYGVGVLNLWGDVNHTQLAQDQLVLLPNDVPDGGSTAMLLGLGLLGLFVGRWKLNRRSLSLSRA